MMPLQLPLPSPAVLFGLGLALIDTVAFSIVKAVSTGALAYSALATAVIMYAITPLLFYAAMKYTSLTVMNLTWDLCSDIIVTAVGLLWFREVLTERQTIGVLLGLIAIILFSSK